MNTKEYSNYVLEWSQKQGYFHVETIEEMLARNLEAYLSHTVIEYSTIAMGLTYREAHKLSETLESKRPSK